MNTSARLEAPTHVLRADVLVVGGGLSATWAAVSAARAGAAVLLVDEGYCGASGVAGAAGVAHWLVPPIASEREAEMQRRAEWGAWLTDRAWQERVLEETWVRLPSLSEWGYQPGRGFGQAPHYLRFLRRLAERVGVKIVDHSPALELLVDRDGVVSGARGYGLRTGEFWACTAQAVVLATGGCAWKSKSLGSDVNTGDGHLFAGELGARFSGMEFSGFYGLLPRGTTMTRTVITPSQRSREKTGESSTVRSFSSGSRSFARAWRGRSTRSSIERRAATGRRCARRCRTSSW